MIVYIWVNEQQDISLNLFKLNDALIRYFF